MQDTKVANERYELDEAYEGYTGAPVAGRDLLRIERLPPDLRESAEALFWLVDQAPNDPRALKLLYKVAAQLPNERTPNERRAAAVDALREFEGWQLNFVLRRIDPAFSKLPHDLKLYKGNAILRYAAQLSVQVNAFNDRNESRAYEQFKDANREAKRPSRVGTRST